MNNPIEEETNIKKFILLFYLLKTFFKLLNEKIPFLFKIILTKRKVKLKKKFV